MQELTTVKQAILKHRLQRFATCWRIARTDGVILYFTDHDHALVVLNQTYVPIGGVLSSARQKQVGMKENNFEMIGVVTSDVITHEDLRAGKYRDAEVTERIVDWQTPWIGPIATTRYWITDYAFNGEYWEAQVGGMSTRLRKRLGIIYGRTCRHNLGDAGCQVNTAPFTHTGAVTALIHNKRHIQTNMTQADNYFVKGSLTFTSGANNGILLDVRTYVNASGEFRFQIDAPYPIQVGDTFSAVRGCNRLFNTCKNTFNNVVNFGGQPHIPGNQKAMRVARG